MTLKLSFPDNEACKSFADRFKLSYTENTNSLTVDWHYLPYVKSMASVTVEQLDNTTEHEFIVQGDPVEIAKHGTIQQDLGGGFYLVSSINGLNLHNASLSFDINSKPMQFLENVGTIQGMNNQSTSLDPLSSDGQWARIRVASTYRPLAPSFDLHVTKYLSKPELYIMDSGINFQHPEFQYDSLEKENFYTLPVFNNDFTDDVGHGTAVAAMAVGKNLGTSTHCKLVNVKIGSSNHNATLLEVGQAIDAILNRIAADPNVTRIINMSWGITRSTWLDSKVQSLIDAGATVICAAGNQGISVEDISPAGLDTVITIGSIDKYDIPSGFNNISPTDSGLTTSHGLSLDMFAPGEDVLIATKEGGYALGSGTSFSAPLVSGIASVIGSLNESALVGSFIKDTLLSTATEHALLFEDDRFSENQNRIAHLITADPAAGYKNNDVASYLGVHGDDALIVVNLNSVLDSSRFETLYPEDSFTYKIEFLDQDTESAYSSFFHLNATTGELNIDKPSVLLPEETKLKMVEFVAIAESSRVVMRSQKIFFFHTNPLYQDTMDSDITLALTETNSISFYALWCAAVIK